jgi:catechol 2,3-dioxygenase-like lactoylglutathione lyase family enzyme
MTVPDMRLELVPIPVSDVDRARAFYEQVGFENVHDTQVTDTMRVVQLTPPGSTCAIVFGTGMGPITDMSPGSIKGLHLVVNDMMAIREVLAAWRRNERHRGHGWSPVLLFHRSRWKLVGAATMARRLSG